VPQGERLRAEGLQAAELAVVAVAVEAADARLAVDNRRISCCSEKQSA
jgi:hypothetical protein